MKKLSKFSILFVFLSLFISSSVLAATSTSSLNTNEIQSQKAIVLANVDIQNIKIISQEGNVFKISFSISNREILQTGVKYGVQLIKENNTNKSIIDEYTYDESLTLLENTSINKEITYTAPAGLNGDYFLRLVSKNSNGFPFAFSNTNAVTLTSSVKGVSILTDSCTLSLNDKDVSQFITTGISLNSTDKLNLTCEGVNSSNTDIEVTPSFDTRYISAYGEVVTVPNSTPVTFKKLEKKSFSVLIPVVSLKPQSYNTSMYLKSGDITSNKIFINYSINGAIATIYNLSLDKESYVKGDTANASIYGLFSNGPLIKNDKGEVTSPSGMTLTASITNDSNRKCSAVLENKISPIDRPTQLNIPIKITRDCINPQFSVTVKDDKGIILAEQIFSFNTGAVKNNNISKWLVISIVVLILIILVYIYLKKKKEDKGDIDGQNSDQNTPIAPIASIFLFIALFSIFGFTSAKVASAKTIVLYDGSTATYSLYTMPGVGVDGALSSNYKANEKFNALVEIGYYSGSNSSITVSINDSNATLKCSTFFMSGNCTGEYFDNSWVITAPSTSGNYNVNLTFKTSCQSGYRFNYSQKCTDPSDSIVPDPNAWGNPSIVKRVLAIDSDKVVYKNYYNSKLNIVTKGDLFTLKMCGITNGILADGTVGSSGAVSGNAIIALYESRLNSDSTDTYDNPCANYRSYYTADGAWNGGLYELTINIKNTSQITSPPVLTVVSQDSGLIATETAAAPYTVTVPTMTLTVTKAGTGTGTVTSVPAGISCGVDCSEAYASGTAVTMTAKPDATSTFAGWSGGPDCTDGSVTMNANKSCTATFNLTTVDSCGTGSGATPILTEPTTNPKACNPGKYINSPSDTTTSGSQAWKWSCGSVTTCEAPKFGCTTITDTNYDANGPSNLYRCANTCKNGYTNYPTCTIPSTGTCFDGIQNQTELGFNAESGIDTGGICAKGTLTVLPASCIIDLNKNNCSITGVTWTTTKATNPALIENKYGPGPADLSSSTFSTLANQTTPLKFLVTYPATKFDLEDDVLYSPGQHTNLLASKTVTASCGTNVWNTVTKKCVSSVGNIGVSLQINGSPTITLPQSSTTLQWMTWGNPTSCKASGGSTGWSGPKNPTSNVPPYTQKMTNLTAEVYTYKIDCIKGTETASASVTLTVIDPNAGNTVTVTVTAYPLVYNVLPATNVSFKYTSSTTSGKGTECHLLKYDGITDATSTWQASSPIVYTVPNNIGSYGYYVQCRDKGTKSIKAESAKIIVNVNTDCNSGDIWNGSACVSNPPTYDGSADQCLDPNLSVKYNNNLDIPVSPNKIPYNSKVTVSWSSANTESCACSYKDAINNAGACESGVANILKRNTTYTLSCTCNGTTKSQSREVLVDKIDIRYIEQ